LTIFFSGFEEIQKLYVQSIFWLLTQNSPFTVFIQLCKNNKKLRIFSSFSQHIHTEEFYGIRNQLRCPLTDVNNVASPDCWNSLCSINRMVDDARHGSQCLVLFNNSG